MAPSNAELAPAAGATAKAPRSSAAGNAGAAPSPIDPESLPPGPLNQADYERVGERNRYLASKYDPRNLYDRFINSFTGAMNDPANVRTPSEQAEHEALSQKIIDTVFPQPTLAEARLNMMVASPIGATLSVFTGALGGSQQTQDLALIAGDTADTFGLGRGLQAGEPPSSVTAAMRRPARVPQAPTPTTQSQPAPATQPARTSFTSAEAVIIDRQAMGVQAQNGKPISGDPFPTNTRPTPGAGQLMGEPEPIHRNTKDPDTKFGIRIQNKSLRMAADEGYSVVQQPKKTLGRDGKPLLTEAQQSDLGLNPKSKPDALINRRVFDVYGPLSESAEGVRRGIADKVNEDKQAHRLVVNLEGTKVTPRQLRQELEKNPISNLKEIILIDQNGKFTNFFPF